MNETSCFNLNCFLIHLFWWQWCWWHRYIGDFMMVTKWWWSFLEVSGRIVMLESFVVWNPTKCRCFKCTWSINNIKIGHLHLELVSEAFCLQYLSRPSIKPSKLYQRIWSRDWVKIKSLFVKLTWTAIAELHSRQPVTWGAEVELWRSSKTSVILNITYSVSFLFQCRLYSVRADFRSKFFSIE